MTDLTHYQKYKQTITAYNHKKVTCECGATIARGCLARHKKSKKHTDKMGEGAAPNTIEWFLQGYDSESDDEEEIIVLKKGDIVSKKCDEICFCCGEVITSKTKGVAQTKRGWICENC